MDAIRSDSLKVLVGRLFAIPRDASLQNLKRQLICTETSALVIGWYRFFGIFKSRSVSLFQNIGIRYFLHVYIILSLCAMQASPTAERALFAPICTIYIVKLLK